MLHFFGYFGSKRVKAKGCGFHLIYMPNFSNSNSDAHSQSRFDTLLQLLRENIVSNVMRSRDDDPKEDSHHTRSRHL